jgi:hypothetical protein
MGFLISLCYARFILHLKMLALEHPVAVYQQSVSRTHIQRWQIACSGPGWLAFGPGGGRYAMLSSFMGSCLATQAVSWELEAIEPAGEAKPTGRAKDIRDLIRNLS